jgi:hypothetical protein
MIQEHTKEISKKLGKSDFKASNGHLESFRKWYQIVFNEVCGEPDGGSEETATNWIAKFPSITDRYELTGTANGDETGLLSHALSSKTLCSKNKKHSGEKLCKEQVTVLLCSFMTGEMETH